MKSKLLTVVFICIVALATILGGVLVSQNYINKNKETTVYLFYSEDEKQSKRMKAFVENYAFKNENVTVEKFDVWNDTKAREVLEHLRLNLDITDCAIPIVIIGDKGLIGYLSDGVSGEKIVNLIENCENECSQKVDDIKKVKFYREPAVAPIDRPEDGNKEDDVC